MKKKVYKSVEEVVYSTTLKNKMKVDLIYKPGFHEKSAYIITKFGHFDSLRKIKIAGKSIQIPWGTAHFLEHRMFTINDVDADELFTSLGASCNAYTTYEKTAYYFTCHNNFYECLEILLKMMSSFSSSKEQIENEKDIILQERNMYQEEPAHLVDSQVYKQAYINHPINVDIIGTTQTIKDTNIDVLKAVFDTFYDPSNLTLVVCGDINHIELENFLNNHLLESKNKRKILPLVIDEPNNVNTEYGEIYLSTIKTPRFAFLYKLLPVKSAKEKDRDFFCYNLILDYLFSSSGKLSEKWLKDKIISSLLEYSVCSNIDLDCIIFYNISDNVKLVVDSIKSVFNVSKKLNMSQQELDDLKKSHYGHTLKVYESVSGLCSAYAYDLFTSYNNFFLEVDEVRKLTIDDINNAYNKICNAVSTLVVLRGD